MWGPQTDYRPHGAYRQSGFLPLIPNTHMVRNQNRYSYGGYSYNPFSAYSMGSPSQNYSNYVVQPGYQSRNFSRIPSMHGGGDYYGGQWNGYYRDRSVREVNPSAAHDVVLGGGGGTHLFNGPQRNASFSKAQMTRNPTWMWPSIQRRGNGGFTHPEFQRYDSFPHAHTGLQREASFGRKPIPRVDSFGVDSVARSDSFSSDRSSNSLYEMGYPSQTSGLNRSTSAASPDPSLSSEEEGLASLLRKQSALHRGETLGCQSEHIGRRSGGLMFKGVEVEK